MDKKYYIRSLDREIDLFYNVLKNFKTNKPQFYMLVSKNKDIDFNISQEEVNKICEKTYGLIKDMEEIYEKISSDIINPLCKKKLHLSYEKFEGDIEELSKEIAEKLNTKGKVFELEILQEDSKVYVKFIQYKNLPTYDDIRGYHFAKNIVKAWDP
ncbi:MAG TPA: hypothetical protein EYH56_02145, partial [Nanoarchaeota archaeon]|nr:hypothetical protein [Nanoarchaeota archaeon]